MHWADSENTAYVTHRSRSTGSTDTVDGSNYSGLCAFDHLPSAVLLKALTSQQPTLPSKGHCSGALHSSRAGVGSKHSPGTAARLTQGEFLGDPDESKNRTYWALEPQTAKLKHCCSHIAPGRPLPSPQESSALIRHPHPIQTPLYHRHKAPGSSPP